jgi:ribosomal protein L30E
MARKSRKVDDSIDLSRKKVKEFDIDTNIKVAYKTGKILYGKSQVLKQIRQNHTYKGSSWELGLAMGKPYMISVIGINDFGDSDLMSLKTKSN